jgi:hypothetical protein
MMEIFLKNKIILAVAALAIVAGLWYGLFGGPSSAPALTTENPSGVVSEENKDIVTSLLQLRSVTLSGTIFTSQVFKGLKDFSTDIRQEPVGRADPFAPLGTRSDTAAAVSGAANTGPFGSRQ